jgi:4-cresol dehydrogenase (hydroxylating)
VAPLEGSHAVVISEIASRVLLAHAFEPMISLTLLTERTIGCVISISYDREVEGEDEKALECHGQLLKELKAEGYFPYRLGIQSMNQMRGFNGYNQALQRVKHALDPKGIISPGRYDPTER